MLALKDVLALFQKCNRLHEALKEKHLLLVARIQSIANMLERLPALSNPNLYRMFSSDPGVHLEVSNAQLKILESTWQAAIESMAEVQQHVDQLKRRDAEVQTLIRRSKFSTAALEKHLGAEPSINDLANTIHDLCGMMEQQGVLRTCRPAQTSLFCLLLESRLDGNGHSLHPIIHYATTFVLDLPDMPHVDPTDFEMMAAQIRDSTELK